MRICYLANASSVHTIKWVRFFVEKGHEVHVVSFENAQIEGAKVHVLRLPILVKNATYPLKLASFPRVRSLIKKIKPDVLHAHYVTNYGLFGALCSFHPFVITTWGSDVLAGATNQVISMIKKYIGEYVLKTADLITCDADHMIEAMRKLGVPPGKIRLICFGIDTRKFAARQKNDRLRKELGIIGSPAVISLRNLEPLYDVESLINSAPIVLKKIPTTKILIAGKGSQERKLRRLAETLGISDSVKFVGFIPQDELPQYLTSVDVYVSTSLSDAGIAASTAEAMACGLPVIVTDVADNRKWVEDGVNGFVVPVRDPQSLAEKIIYLLENEDVSKKFGRAGRKVIEEKNDYYREMGKMENIYQKLVEERLKCEY